MNAHTRPPASTPADHERWRRDYDELDRKSRELNDAMRGESKFGNRYYGGHDGRLTKIIAWIGSILGVIFTTGAIWATSLLVSTDRSVAILLDRPAPVSKAQYDADRQEILAAIHTLQGDVKDIQIKQAATLESNRAR